jgi:hypothetical protein
MLRYIFSVLILVLLPHSAFGVSTQLISGLSSYTPGQAVSFDVHLPPVSNLGSYNIDLVLTSSVGTAGVDYYFDVAATLPAAAHYVFPSTANYFDAVTVDSTTRDRITLSDFDLTGVNLVAGTNDQVAKVVFRTLPTFHGQLNASVDTSLLILDTPDVETTPIAGFSALQSDIAAAGVIPVLAVPEPSTLALLMFAATGWCLRRGRAA